MLLVKCYSYSRLESFLSAIVWKAICREIDDELDTHVSEYWIYNNNLTSKMKKVNIYEN